MNVLILSAIWGIILMMSGLFLKKDSHPRYIALLGIILLIIAGIGDLCKVVITSSTFHDMLAFSDFGKVTVLILLLATLIYFLLSGSDIEKVGRNSADYFALIFFVICGISIGAYFNNLLMLFLGIEIISIPLYALAGTDKKNLKSNEASLKYFLMGAFSTGILLMGIALIYGNTGSFQLPEIQAYYSQPISAISAIGLLLLAGAMSFKVSAVPFHFWAPDVYEGSPTVFTSFMATIVKGGAFLSFIQLFNGSFASMHSSWGMTIAVIIAATLFIGNVFAISQQSVKRMMAYSSIAQAGFMLFAVYAPNQAAHEGFLLYTAAYCLATIGVFGVLTRIQDKSFDGFNGLANHQPVIAFSMTICLLSLAGIPFTAGFMGKYFLLLSAAQMGGQFWLVIFAVLCAILSVYYYFRVIQAMYFKEGPAAFAVPVTRSFRCLLVIIAVLLVALGVFPGIVTGLL